MATYYGWLLIALGNKTGALWVQCANLYTPIIRVFEKKNYKYFPLNWGTFS